MKDQIAACGKQGGVTAQNFAHAALDAIAFMGFPHDFPGCKSHPGAGGDSIGLLFPRCEEPAHGGGLALAARVIGALIISVLLQAQARQGSALELALNWLGGGLPAGLVLVVVRVVQIARLVHHGCAGRCVSRNARTIPAPQGAGFTEG